MDDLRALLSRYNFDEPEEIRKIKAYILEHVGTTSTVARKSDQYVVSVPNAAAAGSLRMHAHTIEDLCNLQKRLIIRIG